MVDDPLDIFYNNYWQYFSKAECLPNSESDLMDAITDVDKALDSIQTVQVADKFSCLITFSLLETV
jgi:hypothetical protein